MTTCFLPDSSRIRTNRNRAERNCTGFSSASPSCTCSPPRAAHQCASRRASSVPASQTLPRKTAKSGPSRTLGETPAEGVGPKTRSLEVPRARGALNDSPPLRRALCWVHYTQPGAAACPHHSTGAKSVRLARIVPEWSYCGRPVRRHKEALKVQRILRAPQSQTEVLDKLTRLGFRHG